MTGPFLISLPKHLTRLDYSALPRTVQDSLFNGISFDPAKHLIGRLTIAILTDSRFKGPAQTRRRRSYERVNQLFIQLDVPSSAFEIIDVYPHTTLAPGLKDPELEVGVTVDPTGKFSISGTLKNLIRRKRHLIIESHNAHTGQWTFLKNFLQDNLLFNLDLLLLRCDENTHQASLICDVKAQEGGRLIRSTRKRVRIEREQENGFPQT